VNFRREVDQYRSERGMVLELRLRYKTRGSSDAEFVTPAFEIQGLPHPSPEVSKELEFSKSRTSNASFMYKARVSRSKHRVYHTHVQRICDLEFKVVSSRFIKMFERRDFRTRAHQSDFKRRSRDQISSMDRKTKTQWD